MLKKILKITYWVVAVAIMAVAVFMVVTLFPVTGNYKIKVVLSGSMEPAIHTGSVVIIKPEANYKIGDVITFGKDTKKDIPTTHRILDVRVEKGVYVYETKGDANKTSDAGETAGDMVIGKVLLSIPFLGFVLNFAKQPFGFAVIVVLPAIIIISDEIKKIWLEAKKIKKKENE